MYILAGSHRYLYAPNILLILVIIIVTCPKDARCETYHPLDIEAEWHFVTPTQETLTMKIIEERTILGAMTHVRHQEEATQVYENFWSQDIEGNLYLHGSINYTFNFEGAYVPPILIVDAPLYMGKSWVTEDVELFDLDGNPQGYMFDHPLSVHFEGDITVPAGVYYSYGIGYDLEYYVINQTGNTYSIFGRRLELTDEEILQDPQEWYSANIGLVKIQYSDMYPPWLLDWWELPYATPISVTSWGQLKLKAGHPQFQSHGAAGAVTVPLRP